VDDRCGRQVGNELVEREQRLGAGRILDRELADRQAQRERIEGDRLDRGLAPERFGEARLALRPDDRRDREPRCDD